MNEKNHDFVQNRQMSEDSPFAYAELGELRKHFTEEQIEFMKAPASAANLLLPAICAALRILSSLSPPPVTM